MQEPDKRANCYMLTQVGVGLGVGVRWGLPAEVFGRTHGNCEV